MKQAKAKHNFPLNLLCYAMQLYSLQSLSERGIARLWFYHTYVICVIYFSCTWNMQIQFFYHEHSHGLNSSSEEPIDVISRD